MLSFASFTSPAWLSLRIALGIPSTRIPFDSVVFASYVLPALVGYFVAALLAVMPQTRTVRIGLWPLIALSALRSALSVDLSFGKAEQKFNTTNFVLAMVAITARTFDWALSKEPLVRHLRPAKSSPSTAMDALNLALNLRGIGWDWSRYKSYTPHDTRPTNRFAFVFYAFLSAIAHTLICGAFHRAVLTLAPVGAGPVPGGTTIFDETLLFPVRYLRASIISVFTAVMIYSAMQMSYDFSTIPAILVFGQEPVQWPPAFHAPWLATSLSDFWGRRWHQFLRHIFLLGGYALYPVFGRAGIVIGTFLGSVAWHQIVMVTLNTQVETWWMLVGFGMMGPGVLAERAFRQLTGRRVGGVAGWFWTMAWLVVWGNLIVEGFARAGMFNYSSPLDSATPLRALVERLATGLDVWLHAL